MGTELIIVAPRGRPTTYSEEITEIICDKLASGQSLKSICKENLMPTERSVFRWLAKHEDFCQQYARARITWADAEFENMMQIADDGTNDTYIDEEGNEKTDWDVLGRSKLRVDIRKWALAKMNPKKYGDSTTIKGDKENPLIPQKELSHAELAIRANELLGIIGISAGIGSVAPEQNQGQSS